MSDDQTPTTPEEETDPWPKHAVEQLDAMTNIDRAKLGKDAWNKWAKANMAVIDDNGNVVKAGKTVGFEGNIINNEEVSFSSLIFPGDVYLSKDQFHNTTFVHSVFFGEFSVDGAMFVGDTCFYKAQFHSPVNFFSVKFTGTVDFDETVFYESVCFEENEFNDLCDFYNARFLNYVSFSNTIFKKGSLFHLVEFLGTTHFSDTTHLKRADFSMTKFKGKTFFGGAVFEAPVNYEGAIFMNVPDFRRTILKAHFTLHNVKIQFWNEAVPKYKIFRMTEDRDAADKLRRLKELAINAKDHEREMSFFSDEIRAKRFHEGGFWKTLTGYFYEWFSFFGRSIFRPFLWLLFVWSGSWSLFLKASESGPEYFWEGLKLSTAAIVPFLGASKTALESSKKALFPDDQAGWVDGIMFAEGLLGFAFIFLIGLALRNRFRI